MYENNVFEHPLRSFENFIKLGSSYSIFFEARANRVGSVWTEENEIDLKFLK
jgi:hypothetical protein